MRGAIKIACVVLAVALVATGQTSKPQHFYWSYSKAHGLDYDKETLQKNTTLSADDKNALIAAVTVILRPAVHQEIMDALDPGKNPPSHAEEMHLVRQMVVNSRVYLADLDGDGVPEVIAQPSDYRTGFCGATGNCSLWIFKKTGATYRLLFDSASGYEMITIEKVRSNGYLDLVLAAHESASEKFLGLFKFFDGTYRLTQCYEANWTDYDHRGMVALKNPDIHSRSCK